METNHKNSLFAGFFTIWLLFSAGHLIAQNKSIAPVVGTQPDGSILVPTNQLLRAAGFQVYMHGRPVDLALIPEKGLLAVKNKNSLEQNLDNYDRIDEDTFNRIIWHAIKGYNRPYPMLSENQYK